MSLMILLPEPKKMKIEMFRCMYCKQSFYYERYLKRHVRRMHSIPIVKAPKKIHKCNLCDKSFTTKNYMYKHRVKAHNMSTRRTSIKCQEENCNQEFSTLAKLRYHLDYIHNFADYNVPEKLKFNSLADYIEWLVEEERNTKCKFIRPRGRFKRTKYTGIDYTCSQNRYLFSKSSVKSMSKNQDSTNTRYHCTAQILVKEYDDHVEALYYKRHYKHDFLFSSPKLLIRRKKAKKFEKKLDTLASVCEAAFSLTDKQYFSESEDANVTKPGDVNVKSLIKQLDAFRLKLLSKTSVDIHIAQKISESLKAVQKLLDNDYLPNNMSSCTVNEAEENCENSQERLFTLKEMQKSPEELQPMNIGKFVNEIFVSTSSANDHDYNKI